jgi:hypothetical protein
LPRQNNPIKYRTQRKKEINFDDFPKTMMNSPCKEGLKLLVHFVRGGDGEEGSL